MGAALPSLSSPISILAGSPSPVAGGGGGGGLVSGPLSAPATFSWGKQSPIPHRNSPGLLGPATSPYLLSPGQEHFPATATAPNLTSSPLLEPPPPSRLYPLAEGRVTPLALPSADLPAPKPSIPVGIAVARQRNADPSPAPTAAPVAAPPTHQPPKDTTTPSPALPWPLAMMPPTPLAPLLHPLPALPDYLPRDPIHGKIDY